MLDLDRSESAMSTVCCCWDQPQSSGFTETDEVRDKFNDMMFSACKGSIDCCAAMDSFCDETLIEKITRNYNKINCQSAKKTRVLGLSNREWKTRD
jgi:hypothetical protein